MYGSRLQLRIDLRPDCYNSFIEKGIRSYDYKFGQILNLMGISGGAPELMTVKSVSLLE